MTLSTRIAPHLAYLRRYARAVTGSQTSGDAHVAAMLEALIADTTLFPEASGKLCTPATQRFLSLLGAWSHTNLPERARRPLLLTLAGQEPGQRYPGAAVLPCDPSTGCYNCRHVGAPP